MKNKQWSPRKCIVFALCCAVIAWLLVIGVFITAKAEDRYSRLQLQNEQLEPCIYIQDNLAVRVGDSYIESYWLNLRYMQEYFLPKTYGKGVVISFKGHDHIYLEGETLGSTINKLNACNGMNKTK